jgi:hypothetical protein
VRPRAALRSPALLFGLGVLVVTALVAYPLRHGNAYLDDFVFIALGRHIDNPWALLVQDSLGTFFFRPLAMFIWWATVQAFGDYAPAHLFFNLAVHAINGVLLYALLRQLTVSATPAAWVALLFIAHPAAFSAAAWLSDRFDLLATTFGLLSLIFTDRYLVAPRPGRFLAALLFAAAAVFSKEIAFAFPAVGSLMIAWTVPSRHTAGRGARLALFVAFAACVLVALGVRPFVLRNVTETMFLRDGLPATLWGGVTNFMRHFPGFIVVMQGPRTGIAAWAALLAAVLAAAASPRARAALATSALARGVVIGIALLVLAVLAQAPVVHASPIMPYEWGKFSFESLAGGRFYYLALAGLAIVAAMLAEGLARAGLPRIVRQALFALSLGALIGMIASDRSIGRDWAALVARSDAALVRAASAAVQDKRDARPGCKIYFLGTGPEALPFRSLLDTAVKQRLPKGHPVAGCFIQSEHAPWYHLVVTAGHAPGSEEPLRTIVFGGKPYPPLPVANLTYFYLRIPDSPAVIDDPAATFYLLENGRFVDATARVRARTQPVRFFDNRPAY